MRILLVEDDEALCAAVAPLLEQGGLPCGRMPRRRRCAVLHAPTDVRAVHSGQDAARTDGLSVLRAARAEGLDTPVLMTTALGLVGDRVDGLDAGADDYLVKPFDVRELLARVRALAPPPRSCGGLRPPLLRGSYSGHGHTGADRRQRAMHALEKEAELLAALMENAGQTLSRSFYSAVSGGRAPT